MAQSKEIPLRQATVAQLREFAQNVLGIDLPANIKQFAAVSQIRQAAPELTAITLPGDEPALDHDALPDAPMAPAATASSPRVGRTRLMIQQQEGPGGDRPIFVSVNGSGMLVPRGETVDVPDPFAEVLRNAVEEHYEQVTDAEGSIVFKPRTVSRFPVSFHGKSAAA